MREAGRFQRSGELNHWIPHLLPPTNPPLDLRAEVLALSGEASFALGQLHEACSQSSMTRFAASLLIFKEASFSWSMEGIHSTLLDLLVLNFEEERIGQVQSLVHDVQATRKVFRHAKAIQLGVERLKIEKNLRGFSPLLKAYEFLNPFSPSWVPSVSSQGFRSCQLNASFQSAQSAQTHGLSTHSPYRRQLGPKEGWVPPPASEVPRLMDALDRYLYEPSKMPPLIRLGLAHAQWEMVRPFEEAHGPMGRLFLLLCLMQLGLLHTPVLLSSVYFKKYALEYQEYLYRVRTRGDFESWVRYFLQGIRDQALESLSCLRDLKALQLELEETVRIHPRFAKMRDTAQCVLDFLWAHPITGIREISQGSNKAYNTVSHALKIWVELGVVIEKVQKRNRTYFFTSYLNVIESERPLKNPESQI